MIVTVSDKKYEGRIQQHAFIVQQKAQILMAFTATIFLLCIENVKAFTAPLSNPDTLFFMASGAHSIAKRWKSKSSTLTIRQTTQSKPVDDAEEKQCQGIRSNQILNQSQRKSSTSLRMAFSFASLATKEDIPTLDMKTSINAFGSWYNKMDPVARPPDYDDYETDYTLTSPADNWPSSFEEEAIVTSTAKYSTQPRTSSEASITGRRPRPIRTIRKIAGWFLGSSYIRQARGFGSRSFL